MFQVFYVVPHIRDHDVAMAEARQEEVARGIARELEIDLERIKNRLKRMARRSEFVDMDVAGQKRTMGQHVEISRLVSSLWVMDAEGRYVSGTGADFAKYTSRSFADKPYFVAPFEKGQVYFSPARFAPDSKILYTFVTVPIHSETGQTVGVLIGGMRLNGLAERVRGYPLQEGRTALLVDSEGKVVAHSGMNLLALEAGPLSLDYSHCPLVRAVAVTEGQKAFRGEHDHHGTSHFGCSMMLASNGWAVVVESPMSVILAKSGTTTKWMLWVNAALFVVALSASAVVMRRITADQKRMELGLRLARDKAQNYLDVAGVIILALDADGNISLINQKGCEILECRQDAALGRNWFDNFLPERVRQETRAIFQALMAGEMEGVEYVEKSVVTGAGRERIISWHNSILTDRHGCSLGTLSSGEDITERKQALEKLHHLNAVLLAIRNVNQLVARERDPHRLVQGICEELTETRGYHSAWIARFDDGGQVLEAVEAGLGEGFLPIVDRMKSGWLTGCGREALGRGQTEVVVTADPHSTCTDCPLAAGHAGKAAMTTKLQHGERTYGLICVSMLGEFVADEQEWAFFREVAEDIAFALHSAKQEDKRERAERALARSERWLRLVLDNSFDGINICKLDPRTRRRTLAMCNDGYVKLAGRSREELMAAEDLNDLVRLTHFPPDLHERLVKGVPCQGTSYWIHPDGTQRHYEWTAASVSIDGELCIIGVDRDTSERRKLEEQLRQAQKMEAIGQLAGGIAHDFNNKLAVIIGYCDMLLRGLPADDASREPVEQIRVAGKDAASLVSQLLAFSRRQPIQPRVVDLNSLLRQMHDSLKRMLGGDIDLSMVHSPESGNILIDPTQFQQIIMNLAANSRDAMPAGGQLTIETASVELGEAYVQSHPGVTCGPYVMVVVTDTGEGMTAGTLEHIFEPFFTTKEIGRGTGLGLATVYGVIQQAGGSINVSSQVQRGTTFSIYLPCTQAPAEQVEPAVAAPGVLARGVETILVVEDEQALRQLVVRVLRDCGYIVLEAGSAREALPVGEHYEGQIDLLLVDMVIPGMSGPEVAERIKVVRPNIAVVFISGYPREVAAQHGMVGPGVNLLSKPFGTETLAETVRRVLDQAGK